MPNPQNKAKTNKKIISCHHNCIAHDSLIILNTCDNVVCKPIATLKVLSEHDFGTEAIANDANEVKNRIFLKQDSSVKIMVMKQTTVLINDTTLQLNSLKCNRCHLITLMFWGRLCENQHY